MNPHIFIFLNKYKHFTQPEDARASLEFRLKSRGALSIVFRVVPRVVGAMENPDAGLIGSHVPGLHPGGVYYSHVYLAGACVSCAAPTFSSPCGRCGNFFCNVCAHTFHSCLNIYCSSCWCVCVRVSCRVCGMHFCQHCDNIHQICHRDDFHDSPRGNVEEPPRAGTGGLEDQIQQDDFAKIMFAWDRGGDFQLKRTTCIRVENLPNQLPFDDGIVRRNFGDCINDFQLLANRLAWDLPNGIVIVQLDKKKALVFQPDRQANAVELATGLSWAKSQNAMALTIRKRQDMLEFGVMDVFFFLGQASRLRSLQVAFLVNASALCSQ